MSDMIRDSINVKGLALREIIAQYFGVGYENVIPCKYSFTVVEPQKNDPRKKESYSKD